MIYYINKKERKYICIKKYIYSKKNKNNIEII